MIRSTLYRKESMNMPEYVTSQLHSEYACALSILLYAGAWLFIFLHPLVYTRSAVPVSIYYLKILRSIFYSETEILQILQIVPQTSKWYIAE